MKKTILTLGGFAIVLFAIAGELTWKSPYPEMNPIAAFHWVSTKVNFGEIKKGTVKTHEFSFTNTGELPLIISSVKPSCGCTVASYTTDPIEPGMTGMVKVTYNANHPGAFNKSVVVNANTIEGATTLTLSGVTIE